MSDPFTTPADGSWQELLDEIVLAYSERRQVLGQSAYVAADDKDVQAASYWTTMQAWLETNCVSFIDHDNGPLTDGQDDFLYFDIDTWRAAAGLNANGFRRKYGPKESLVEAYGQMQAGDAIGPWIFEDLQKGLGALKWLPFFRDIVNVRGIFPGVTGNVSYYGYGSGPSPDTFGVWYSYFGTRLGGTGTYTITLDARHLAGSGGAWYISLGRSGAAWDMSGDGGGIILDTGRDSGVVHFASSLTFYDDASLVEIYGCRLTTSTGADSVAASFMASSVSVSANLNQNLEGVACFEFFPVIKIPFSNA